MEPRLQILYDTATKRIGHLIASIPCFPSHQGFLSCCVVRLLTNEGECTFICASCIVPNVGNTRAGRRVPSLCAAPLATVMCCICQDALASETGPWEDEHHATRSVPAIVHALCSSSVGRGTPLKKAEPLSRSRVASESPRVRRRVPNLEERRDSSAQTRDAHCVPTAEQCLGVPHVVRYGSRGPHKSRISAAATGRVCSGGFQGRRAESVRVATRLPRTSSPMLSAACLAARETTGASRNSRSSNSTTTQVRVARVVSCRGAID